jgi:hypothetical protein
MPVRPPIPELLKFLSAYDKPVVALACALRKKVLTAAPLRQKRFTTPTTPSRLAIRSRGVSVAIQKGHVLVLSANVRVIPPQSIVKAIYARKRRPAHF